MFTVFEGIDGSGKTTLSGQVVRRLEQRGISVKHLRVDGKFSSAIAETLRALTRDCRNVDLLPKTEFLLYVAREVQQIGELLRPALSTTSRRRRPFSVYAESWAIRRQLDPSGSAKF